MYVEVLLKFNCTVPISSVPCWPISPSIKVRTTCTDGWGSETRNNTWASDAKTQAPYRARRGPLTPPTYTCKDKDKYRSSFSSLRLIFLRWLKSIDIILGLKNNCFRSPWYILIFKVLYMRNTTSVRGNCLKSSWNWKTARFEHEQFTN